MKKNDSAQLLMKMYECTCSDFLKALGLLSMECRLHAQVCGFPFSTRLIAVWLHEEYERISKIAYWDTRKECKVSFGDLPVANQLVLLKLAELVQLRFGFECQAFRRPKVFRWV